MTGAASLCIRDAWMLKVRKSVGESIDKLFKYFDRFDQDLINGSNSISHDFDMIILVF